MNNSKIDSLVAELAAAYLKERQGDFVHLGIRIPLDTEILTLALQTAWPASGVPVSHPDWEGRRMNPTNQSRMNALLEQLADTLEQTYLCPVERAQYSALLDALRKEVAA